MLVISLGVSLESALGSNVALSATCVLVDEQPDHTAGL